MRIYALSHEPVETLKELQEEMGDTVTFLSDPDGKAIDAFGMLDRDAFPQKKLARAGIFHIDRKGMIRHVWLTENYRRRPDADTVVERIKQP